MAELTFFAACNKGCEPALESELIALGASDVEMRRSGVAFRGSRRIGYAANLWLRSAIRVQEQLLDTHIDSAGDLYDAVAELEWNRWCTPDHTLAVFASVTDCPSLTHSGFAALKTKDAIVDVLRERSGRRPDVDTKSPDVPLKLVVKGSRALLYRDLSGASLHKRGWRPVQVKSPLNEATAAALILMTDWDRCSPVVDPMCGSGTFPIEAAMIAADRAPGLNREFAFERAPDLDAACWRELREEATDRAKSKLGFAIHGGDRHSGSLALARRGAEAAGVAELVRFSKADARALEPNCTPSAIFTNPPYGNRIGLDEDDLIDSWKSLGNYLHGDCGGATAWVLCGSRELTRHLGLRTTRRVPVMNGPIECRWLRYDIRSPN